MRSWCLDSPAAMAEQMEHLGSISEMPSVDLGIVAAFTPAPFTAPHGFDIYDSAVVPVARRAGPLLSDRDDIVTCAELFSRIAGPRRAR